jgi:hypothetical protein
MRSHPNKEGMECQREHGKVTTPDQESKASVFHEIKHNASDTKNTHNTKHRAVPHPPSPRWLKVGVEAS